MGIGDKISNKAEELKGKLKEATGKATGDEDLEAEGKVDQAEGKIKQAAEKVRTFFTAKSHPPLPGRTEPSLPSVRPGTSWCRHAPGEITSSPRIEWQSRQGGRHGVSGGATTQA
jgi:uncharacterized protein YjbJ (UPF0337 family)